MREPRIIKAIFQGKDGSLGYRYNQVYELTILRDEIGKLLVFNNAEFSKVGIRRRRVYAIKNKGGACWYDTEKTFLQNWMTPRKVLVEKIGHPTIRTS